MVAFTVDHLLCTHCQYDLNGQNIGGLCPECGTPVRDSHIRDGLRLSDSKWLKRIKIGLILLNVGLAYSLVTTILYLLLPIIAPAIYTAYSNTLLARSIVVGFLAVIATWIFSTPEPRLIRVKSEGDSSFLISGIRVTVIVDVLVTVGLATRTASYETHYDLLLFLTIVIMASNTFFWIYFRSLVLRIPRRHLASFISRFLIWLLCVSVCFRLFPELLRALRTGKPLASFLFSLGDWVHLVDSTICIAINILMLGSINSLIRLKSASSAKV